MAKKRKAAARQLTEPAGPKAYDTKDARLGPITTYEDLADEQEEYFLERDRIMFDDEPGTKRQRMLQQEDEFLELSDEEVLGGVDSSDSDDASEADRKKRKKKAKKAGLKTTLKKGKNGPIDGELDDVDDAANKDGDGNGEDDDGDDQGWWGASRKEYYDGEAIETEANALEEEAEARRLQKKQLSRMKASDFFDEEEWAWAAGAAGGGDDVDGESKAAAATAEDAGGVVTMTLRTADEISTMTPEEQHSLLRTLYPEFDYMCDEFATLEPLLIQYKKDAEGKASHTLEVVQYRVLSCYLATMALYFSLLMAPTRDNPGGSTFLTDPAELHEHEVMEYLLDSRQTWQRVQRVQARRKASVSASGGVGGDIKEKNRTVMPEMANLAEAIAAKKTAKSTKPPAEKKEKEEKVASTKLKMAKKDMRPGAVSRAMEDSLADLSTLLSKTKKQKKSPAARASATAPAKGAKSDEEDGLSDFGEEEVLDARTADEKLKRKKSLGFYTSQIMQKANLRSGTGSQAAANAGGGGGGGGGGGDVDIPYRERLRDRQARLNAAAVRRGQSAVQPGEELGAGDDDDDDDDDDDGNQDGGADDKDANLAYYNRFAQAHKDKLDAKAARKAEVEAGKLQRVAPDAAADQDGRRQLTWAIAKNKGLNHRSIKEKKNNPRVKKRLKFEKKTKQLASMRAVYKGGDRTNYQGELTGIKTGLVRSIKLS
ncbi:sas10 utp3 family protein [Niveomyces insectorum RCEF 264]|uniref:Sas10 utp3 family protein n=1 Tax=Niveomyces insectorum RCEF 264 TaxID=1081102 RepID=A0A167WXM4_9HYPO|nr:sas10 utp3 family protein [Niveomyces insectorum RCEF 264]